MKPPWNRQASQGSLPLAFLRWLKSTLAGPPCGFLGRRMFWAGNKNKGWMGNHMDLIKFLGDVIGISQGFDWELTLKNRSNNGEKWWFHHAQWITWGCDRDSNGDFLVYFAGIDGKFRMILRGIHGQLETHKLEVDRPKCDFIGGCQQWE